MESQENANVSQQEMNVIMDSPKDEVEESQKYSDASLQPVEVSVTPESGTKKERSRKLWKDVSEETSHTKFFKRPRRLEEFKHVTREEYYSISESMSGSADTFRCIHGPEGKQYTEKGLLKRNIKKNVDPMPFDHKWSDECPSTFKWDVALMLERMVMCPTVELQLERLQLHLRDFAKTSRKGIRVDTLHSFSVIINYLLESDHTALLREEIVMLLENTQKPLLIIKASDVISYIDVIANYISFMAYLLIRLHDDELFNIVSKAILFHLSAPDSTRGPGTVHLRHTMIAAGPVLTQTISRMVAVADDNRFRTFLEITLLLACNSKDNCLEMMQENVIEIIFYRFNPYFPDKTLPYYDINPHDCQDANLKLGVSSVHMSTVLSLLLVLLKTTLKHLEEVPSYRRQLPVPDCYAQRCFVWAYRYECRAREHRHERITLTVIAQILIKCYGDKLLFFSSQLMPDVMSLSVLTELPLRKDWTATVNFTTSQQDVQFKKKLIHFVVFLLKVFPYNKFMIESRHWMQGLVYLLDPGLCVLRSHWSPALFAEIRKTALQALVCTIPLTDPKLVTKYGLIRRLMWYIEWYSESPYELPVLYWCVRLLQVATHHRQNPEREKAVQDLFDTHGIIILINLCNTLLDQKLPPVEKSQAILALSLRLLTSAVIANQRVTCVVYPTIRWPVSVNGLARRMMDAVLYSLDRNYIVSDRWLVSLLNFIWEAIVWRLNFREEFVADDGIYKMLDLITMTRPPVRCIALALVCDIARAGEAIGQLVSWRANTAASNANPKVVNRGDTIAALLASVFYQDCISSGVKLSEDGVIQDLDCPIMSIDCRNELFDSDEDCGMNQPTPSCLAAASLAGSCMSKAFAILHMLTEDLEHKVSLADESYNLYKNIKLSTKDEVILVLCSHYLTLKLNEVWKETQIKIVPLFVRDDTILNDFLKVGIGWAKEIKRQQENVIANYRKSEREQESSLYAFLGRVRLNIALDALRSVRCVARSTEHTSITTQLLHDAVFAHHRRSELANIDLLRTYVPALDDQNITGQNVKITSIRPKKEKEEKEQGYCSCSLGRNVVCVEGCMHRKKRDS